MTAPSQEDVDVVPGVRIPASELEITAISGSGPGGQHVNRSATRIALQWNVRHTRALGDAQFALHKHALFGCHPPTKKVCPRRSNARERVPQWRARLACQIAH